MDPPDQNPLDVCCAADLCVDLIVSGDVVPRFQQVEQWAEDYILEIGGSATIFASQFVKLGGRAGLVGVAGEDAFGAVVLEKLARLDIDGRRVKRQAGLKTGLGVALVRPDGDRAILTYPGSIDGLGPADLDEALLSTCRHWHIASYFLLNRLRGQWQSWLERCEEAGMSTSLDPNWDPSGRWEGVLDLLPHVDVFFPNEAEARAISGETDLIRAGRRLADQGPLVVVKRGREGAMVFTPGLSEVIRATGEAGPPLRIIDTVGAGDNFDAGFLRGWRLGWTLERCLDLAHRCARASLAAAGGIEGQLREVVEERR